MLNGARAEDAFAEAPASAREAARLARRVARLPHGGPRGPAQWRAFRAAMDLAEAIGDPPMARAGRGLASPALVAGAAGKWDGIDPEATAAAARGLADALRDVRANALAPAARAAGSRSPLARDRIADVERADRLAFAVLLGGRDLRDAAAAHAWWQGAHAAVRARLSAGFPGADAAVALGRWPPLHAEPWRAPDGTTATCLASAADLDAEHRAMDHCIDTYARPCAIGGAQVVSFRTEGGGPLSTAHISEGALVAWLAAHEGKLPEAASLRRAVVREHRGKSNAAPPERAARALDLYLDAIAGRAVKVDLEAAQARADRGRAASARLEAACYEEGAPGAVEAAWRAYGPFMPRSLRRGGPAAAAVALDAAAAALDAEDAALAAAGDGVDPGPRRE
jgi:hypothetical protein